MPVFISVDQRAIDKAMQLSIQDESGGYRIAGPKFDGHGKQLFRHALSERDVAEIRMYLEQVKPASLPADVRRLIIAARVVAFSDQSQIAIDELDEASEAFADRVPWEDEPVNISRGQRRYADRR